jgi:LmbE family N-acetylglucosaminyl deacetylase
MSPEPLIPRPRLPGVDRRLFLIGTLGAAGVGSGLGFLSDTGDTSRPERRPRRGRPGTVAARSRFMQIVAHEDDDLLFMTPDLRETLRAGSPHLTAYLSAGESKAGIPPDTHDVNAYTAERETGLRTAYALMLGVRNTWERRTLEAGPLRIESWTLVGSPQVQLVFLRLPDGRDPRANLSWHTLSKLWADTHTHRPELCGWTQAPLGSPFRQCLSREDVLTALVGLIERFQPTVVRAQDVAPDERYSADHPDHIAAAHFAGEAVRRYTARHPERFVLQVDYRDYNIRNLAVNLGDADRRLKQLIFSAYTAHDYRINYENPHWDAYEARMVYRWPRGTGFATADSVFAVEAGRLVAWRRSGGRWEAPVSLGDPGGALAPAVVAAGPVVLGLRIDTGEIVAYGPEGWQSLGRPDPGHVRNQAGTPVAATDGSGVLGVFVRNGRGGVSARFLDNGVWSRHWSDLPGVDLRQVVLPPAKAGHGDHHAQRYGDVQDGLAAVVAADGRIELFAATRAKLLWWRQPTPGEPLGFAGTLPVTVPVAPLTAEQSGGRVRVLFREAWTGRVRAVSRMGVAGPWSAPAPVAAAAGGLDGEPPVAGPLPPFEGRMVGVPALLPEGTELCVLGADGRLYGASRSGGAHAAWQVLGG